MFKLIRIILGLILLAAIVFLSLSLLVGGKPFRWFGEKSEHAGEVLKKKSEDVGEKADRLKQRSESLKEETDKVKKGINKTSELIREFTGSEPEKKKNEH